MRFSTPTTNTSPSNSSWTVTWCDPNVNTGLSVNHVLSFDPEALGDKTISNQSNRSLWGTCSGAVSPFSGTTAAGGRTFKLIHEVSTTGKATLTCSILSSSYSPKKAAKMAQPIGPCPNGSGGTSWTAEAGSG